MEKILFLGGDEIDGITAAHMNEKGYNIIIFI